MISVQQLEAALVFLGRTTLNGNEAQTFMDVVQAVQQERQRLLLEMQDAHMAELAATAQTNTTTPRRSAAKPKPGA